MSDELEEMIQIKKGYVIVQITENYYNIDEENADFKKKVENKLGKDAVSFIQINLSNNRQWALGYKVFGSPATLIFKDGALYLRILGRFCADDFLERF